MIRRRKRLPTTLDDSSEDDCSPDLMSSYNSQFLKTNLKRNNSSNLYKYKSRTKNPTEDTSSSENEEVFQSMKQRSLRALSDYESGNEDKTGRASSSSASSSLGLRKLNMKQSLPENNEASSNGHFIATRKRCKHKIIESSSDEFYKSDDEFVTIPSRRGSLRALSDYETGDSNDRAASSTSTITGVNPSSSSSFFKKGHCNSSSEDDVIMFRSKKRNRLHDPFVSSDSSDGEVLNQNLRKRRRIATSSDDSDAENYRDSQPNMPMRLTRVTTQLRGERFNRNFRSSSTQQNTIQPFGRYGSQRNRNQIVNSRLLHSRRSNRTRNRLNTARQRRFTNTNQRWTITPAIPAPSSTQRTSPENETIRSRSRRNRTPRVSYFEGYNSDSEDSLLNSTTRRRGANTTTHESDSNDTQRTSPENEISQRRTRSYRTPRVSQVQSYSSSYRSDSDDGLFNVTTRRRGANIAIPESDSDESHTLQHFGSKAGNHKANSMINKFNSVKRAPTSSESDGESEKCPICLTRFNVQEVGLPDACDHSFCTPCIQEWTKSNNTCPVDRKQFDEIIVRSHFEGRVVRRIKVQPPTASNVLENDAWFDVASILVTNYDFSDYEGPEEVCCVCRRDDDSDDLIGCDYCQRVFHLTCLNPPLDSVPAGHWFCAECGPLNIIWSWNENDTSEYED